jgi:predicted kinase
MGKNVYILRGLPGSGKSTYARQLRNASIVSADDFFVGEDGVYRFDPLQLHRAHQQCWLRFAELTRSGTELVVVDNTNLSPEEIAPYVLPAEALGYTVTIYTFLVDPAVASRCNVHGVPALKIGQMHERMMSARLPPWWTNLKMAADDQP